MLAKKAVEEGIIENDLEVGSSILDMKLASEKDIEEFVEEAEERLDAEVEKAVLFGSYAREEHVPGSDIDILFVVEEVNEEDKEVLNGVQREFLKRDLLFSPKLISGKEFERKVDEGYVFHESVEEEGVEI
ncbi:MAG: nucleotidyltransferase domain-containing protein [Candidatus Nanohaloarchaea archaeon]